MTGLPVSRSQASMNSIFSPSLVVTWTRLETSFFSSFYLLDLGQELLHRLRRGRVKFLLLLDLGRASTALPLSSGGQTLATSAARGFQIAQKGRPSSWSPTGLIRQAEGFWSIPGGFPGHF